MKRPVVTIEVESQLDQHGRQSFTAIWGDPTTGRERAQCFRTVLSSQKTYWRDLGYRVIVVDKTGKG